MFSKIKELFLNFHEFTNNINEFLNRTKPFLLSVFVTLFSFSTYFILVGQPIWGTNDDVAMSMMSAGIWFSEYPTSEIMFIHYYFGLFISCLFNWNSEVPWYSLTFIFLIGLSILMISYSVLRVNKGIISFFIIILASIGTVIPALSHLQFTIVAGLMTLSGVVVLLSICIEKPNNYVKSIGIVLGALLFIQLGALIRIDSFLLVFLLCAPFSFVLIWKLTKIHSTKSNKQRFLTRIVFVLSLLIIGLYGLYIQQQNHINSSKEWKEWYRLNQLKSEFNDYNRIKFNKKTKPYFEAIGWNENHYKMIKSWQYIDPVEFASEKFEYIVHHLKNKKLLQNNYENLNFKELKKNAFSALSVSFVLLSLIIILLFISHGSLNTIWFFSVLFLTFTSIYFYLYLGLNRIPFRVLILFPITGFFLLMLIYNNGYSFVLFKSNRLKYIVYFAFLYLLFFTFRLEFSIAKNKVRFTVDNQIKLEEQIQTWSKNLPKNAILYNTGSELNLEAHLPLKSFNYFKSIKNIINLGWSNQSPHSKQNLEKLGLNGCFFDSLAKKDYVYFINKSNNINSNSVYFSLLNYYKEIKGIKLNLRKCSNLPGLYKMEFRKIK